MARVPMRVLSVIVLSTVALSAVLVTGACSHSTDNTASVSDRPDLELVEPTDASYDYDYVIPPGTGERMDAGEVVEIVPAELNVKVGENIRVVNEDVRGAAVGMFWVPAKSSVAMEFNSVGTLVGNCDVHPSGKFTITVTDA